MKYSLLHTIRAMPSVEELAVLKKSTREFIALLSKEIAKARLPARIRIGGSFAKGTLIKSEMYEVDIFLQTKGDVNELINRSYPVLTKLCSREHFALEQLHGSRDYFRIKRGAMIFEIVPVVAVRRPEMAHNVTDVSYSHVSYIKKQLKKNKSLQRQIALAKLFCKAQGVYGAESYVHGFSGYALECLIIAYGSFLEMAKALAKAEDKIILDPEVHYKSKQEISIMMNESKTQGPIVLVDPTWKERNVLAALSKETFLKFQQALKNFLKRPSVNFFEAKRVRKEDLIKYANKTKRELVHVILSTDKQAGDIAGTKLLKFAEFIEAEMGKHFSILRKEFVYSGGKEADSYYIVKPKKAELMRGPPLSMKEHAEAFRKEHAKTLVKKDRLYAIIGPEKSASGFLKRFLQDYEKTVREMDISSVRVVD